MNKQKILIAVFVILSAITVALAAVFFFTREVKHEVKEIAPHEVKEITPLADLSLSAVISRCEAALDEFTPGAGNPPQRVCKLVEGAVRVFSSDAELRSEIRPGDTIVISLNLPGRFQRPWRNAFRGEYVTMPRAETRLCFVTYPVLMRENMAGYPNIDENAHALFYASRPWSYHPSGIFDTKLKGNNLICSNALRVAEFPKVSFVITIPSRDILRLGQRGFDTRTYGVKIVAIPDRLMQGLTMDAILEHYESFPAIYFLRQPIVGR